MSEPRPVELLRDLARQFRARVRAVNLHDPQVATSELDWRTMIENASNLLDPTAPASELDWGLVEPPAPDRFRHEVTMTVEGRRFAARANDRYIVVEARIHSAVVFSINRPDRLIQLTQRVRGRMGPRRLAVYVGEGVTRNHVLNDPKLTRCIEKLALGRHESLHVAANGLRIYLTTPLSKRRIVSVVRRTGSLIKQLPEAAEPSVDLSALPQRFSELIPLMRTWSISDDSDRGNKLARASTERLTRLVKAVTPHFKAINRHLDEFRHRPVSEPAAMLGTLAECACEAQLLLATRRR